MPVNDPSSGAPKENEALDQGALDTISGGTGPVVITKEVGASSPQLLDAHYSNAALDTGIDDILKTP